jgi:Integron cassette protein VCH_CASS1 chain
MSNTDFAMLHQHSVAVMERATHHGQNVDQILPCIIGNVVIKCVPNTVTLRQHLGKPANIALWTSQATGRRYACCYSHTGLGSVELRANNHRGAVVCSFDNSNTAAQINAAFANL